MVAASTAAAQEQPEGKRVVVRTFDDQNVTSSVENVFGGEYDLGRGIAALMRTRLEQEGLGVVEREADAHGTVSGAVLIFGREEAKADVGGVSLGRLRVGVGRRREIAIVLLEAQLLDAGGQLVGVATGRGESTRGGTNVFARLKGGDDLARIDLSSDEFRETAIGEATYKAVEELSRELASQADALGTVAPVAAAEPTPPAEPAAPIAAPPPGGPVGTFAWAPYQFRGTERFRYDVRQTEDGDTQSGFYQLDLEPAGQGRVRMKVTGRLGDESYSSTVTTGVGPEGIQMGMGQFVTLGPIGITLFNPLAWMMFSGRELAVGDGWSYSGGGESVAIQVERECSQAGQRGLLTVLRTNGEIQQESCVARDVALPLRTLMREDGWVVELKLVEYRP
jgi:hypothetical protein